MLSKISLYFTLRRWLRRMSVLEKKTMHCFDLQNWLANAECKLNYGEVWWQFATKFPSYIRECIVWNTSRCFWFNLKVILHNRNWNAIPDKLVLSLDCNTIGLIFKRIWSKIITSLIPSGIVIAVLVIDCIRPLNNPLSWFVLIRCLKFVCEGWF